MLKPVEKKSLADAVFEQLRDEIVSGRMGPGTTLPAERALVEMLNVNRGAVREALKKLEQARLVTIQHGGATRVLDFRETGGLDLIAALVTRDGKLEPRVVRGFMELRSGLGTDIVRRCAARSPERGTELLAITTRMSEAGRDLDALLVLNIAFWNELVEGSGNVAYRLAYNSVRDLLDEMSSIFASLLAPETTDVETHRRIAQAVADGEVDDAEFYARDLLSRGEERVSQVTELFT